MKLRRSSKGAKGEYAMSASMPDAPTAPQTIGEWILYIVVHAMFAIAGLMGVLVVISGVRQFLGAGEIPLPVAALLTVVGFIFIAIGFGFFYVRYVKQPLWDAERARLEARHPDQPWMFRKDWAERRAVHSEAGLVIFLWVWTIGWCGALGFIGTVNHDKILAALESSWWSYLLLVFFVLCGVAGLRLAIAATWRMWRFGNTVLRIDTLPAYIGEQFRGTVEARLSARPTAPLKLALVCDHLQWTMQRRGGKTTSKLDTKELSRIERQIEVSRILTSRNGARIPIEIDVPPGGREYAIDSEGNGIRWTLHVEALEASTSFFSCVFEVPVYARRK